MVGQARVEVLQGERPEQDLGTDLGILADGTVVLHGPIEALWSRRLQDPSVTAGLNERWPLDAPKVRRMLVPPVL